MEYSESKKLMYVNMARGDINVCCVLLSIFLKLKVNYFVDNRIVELIKGFELYKFFRVEFFGYFSGPSLIYSLFVCFGSCLLSCNADAEEILGKIPPLNPVWSFEDHKNEDFLISMLQIYSFYGSVSNYPKNQPNLIFISGEDYIENGHLNLAKTKKFFPGFTQEISMYFQGTSDSCLVFKVPAKGLTSVIGVNDTKNSKGNENQECVIKTISLFLGEDVYSDIKGIELEIKGRNFIEYLQDVR